MEDKDVDLEASTFDAVEKDLYVDPPNIPDDTPDDLKLLIWQEWQKKDAAKRRAHKAAFNRKIKASVPDFALETTTYKSGGVYRQRTGSVAIEGEEDSLEHTVAVPATQDKHFQARGSKAGNKQRNRKNKRKINRHKKTQKILNSRSLK